MLIIFLLYIPKRYFSDVNVGKVEESSRVFACDVIITLRAKQVV